MDTLIAHSPFCAETCFQKLNPTRRMEKTNLPNVFKLNLVVFQRIDVGMNLCNT